MPLDGGKLVCLNDDGSKGTEVLARGSIFRIGYLMNNDYILQDARALPTHCEICTDAWDRITIHNKSGDNPVKLNDQVVHVKSRLFSGSKITILESKFLWEFEKPESIEVKQSSLIEQTADVTPLRQEDGKPAAYSCPDFRFHREVYKRLTVHNFAYCIHHNEEGNTSSELDNTTSDMGSIAEELEEEEAEKEKLSNQQAENERCTTPEVAQVNNSQNSTPITQVLSATSNKTTRSTEKKINLVSSCKLSDVLITSFTPRETGVRIDKSFTAIVKSKMTPKSLYSTPKSLLYETISDCEQSRNLTSNFCTPSTSKRPLTHNTSMHVVDFTTPKKLAPASPMPKSILKKNATKITPRQLVQKDHTSTPSNAAAALGRFNSTSSETGSSVEIVDSSPEIIEISGEDDSKSKLNTPQRAVPPLSKIMTPKRTPQTLRQRVLLNSAKKSCMTVGRNLHDSANSQNKRLSLCTPTRKNATIISTPLNAYDVGNKLSTSTPKSKYTCNTQFMPSTSKSATSSSLHGIRNAVGNTTFSGRITKNRKLMPLSRSMICVKSQQILAKACKTLISPPNKVRLSVAKLQTPLAKSAQKLLKNTPHSGANQETLETSQNVEQNFEEQKSLNVTFSPVKENSEQSLNGTFSLDKELEVVEQGENMEIREKENDDTYDDESQDKNDKQINNDDKNEATGKNNSGRETDELLKEITDILNKSDELQRKRASQIINKENNKNNVNEKIIKTQIEHVVPSMPLISIEMENKKNKLNTPLKTPKLCGIRELMQLPKSVNQSTPNFIGMKNLLRSPKLNPLNDNEHFEGLKFMLQTPPVRRASMTVDMEIRTCTPQFTRGTLKRRSHFEGMGQRNSLSTRRLLRRRSVGGFETELRQTDVNQNISINTANEKEISEVNSIQEEPKIDEKLDELPDNDEEGNQIFNTENEIKSSPVFDKEENVQEKEEEEDFIPETQAIDFVEKQNFDCFLKSPGAKNLMVSTRQTDILDKTDDDINSSEPSEFGNLFKPLDGDEDSEKINTSTDKTADIIVTEIAEEEKNLSSEEKFDKLLDNDESSSSSSFLAKTPMVSKVYTHRSTNAPAFSPFMTADVISDLPKTDIEAWVNSLEIQKPNDNNDEDSVDILENEKLKSSTPSIEEDQQDDVKSDISGIMPLDKSDESSVLMEQLRLSDDSDVEESNVVAEDDEDEEIPETQVPCISPSPAKIQNISFKENTSNETQILENETLLIESENVGEKSDTSTISNNDQEKINIEASEVINDNGQNSEGEQFVVNEIKLNKSRNEEENHDESDISFIENEEKTESVAVKVEDYNKQDNKVLDDIITNETQIIDDGNKINESKELCKYSEISHAEKEVKLDEEETEIQRQILGNETLLIESENERENSDTSTISNLEQEKTEIDALEQFVVNEIKLTESRNEENHNKSDISYKEYEEKLDKEKTESVAFAVVEEGDNEQEIFTNESQIVGNETIQNESQNKKEEDCESVEIEDDNDQKSNRQVDDFELGNLEPEAINDKSLTTQKYDESSLNEISNIIEHEEDNITKHNSLNENKEEDMKDEMDIKNEEDETKKVIINVDRGVNQQDKHETSKSVQEEKESNKNHTLYQETEINEVPKAVVEEFDMETIDNENINISEEQNKNTGMVDNENKPPAFHLKLENEKVLSDDENNDTISEIVEEHEKKQKKEFIKEKLKDKTKNKEEVLELIKEPAENEVLDNANEVTDEITKEPLTAASMLESENIFETEISIDENTNKFKSHDNKDLLLADDTNEKPKNADEETKAQNPNETSESILNNDTEMGLNRNINDEIVSERLTSITNDGTDKKLNSHKSTQDVSLSTDIVDKEIVSKHADIELNDENNIHKICQSTEIHQTKIKKIKFEGEFKNINSSDKSISSNINPIIKSNLSPSNKDQMEYEETVLIQQTPKMNSDDLGTSYGSEIQTEKHDVIPIHIDVQIKVNSPIEKDSDKEFAKIENIPEGPALEEKEVEVNVQVEEKKLIGAGRKRKGTECDSEISKVTTKKKSSKESASEDIDDISPRSTTSIRSSRIAKKAQKEIEVITENTELETIANISEDAALEEKEIEVEAQQKSVSAGRKRKGTKSDSEIAKVPSKKKSAKESASEDVDDISPRSTSSRSSRIAKKAQKEIEVITENAELETIATISEDAALEEKEIEVKAQQKSVSAGRKRKGTESDSEIVKVPSKKKSAKESASEDIDDISPRSTSSRSSRIAKNVQKEIQEVTENTEPEAIEKRPRRGRNANKLDVIVEAIVSESAEACVELPSSSIVNVIVEKVGRRGRKPSATDSPLQHKTMQQALLRATLTASTPSNKEKLMVNDISSMQEINEMTVDISEVPPADADEKAEEESMPEISRLRTRGRQRVAKEVSQANIDTPATRTRRGRKISEKTENPLPSNATTLIDESATTSKVADHEENSQLPVSQTVGRTRRALKVNLSRDIVDTTATRTTRRVREKPGDAVERDSEENEKKSTTKKDKAPKKVVEEKNGEEPKKALTRRRQAKGATAKNTQNIEEQEELEKPIDDVPTPVENKKAPVRKRGRKISERSVDEQSAANTKTNETSEKSISAVEPVKKRGRKISEKSVDEVPIIAAKSDDTIKKRTRRGAKTSKIEEQIIEISEDEEDGNRKNKNKRTDVKHVHASSDSDANNTLLEKDAAKETTTKTTKAKRGVAKKNPPAEDIQQVFPAEVQETEKKVGRATRGRKNVDSVVTESVEKLVTPPIKRSTRARK